MRKYVRITTNGVTRRLHRVIMEEYLGRPLTKAEVVHHKNRKRDDNRLENLQILSYKEHTSVHKEDVIKATNRWRKKWMRENMEKEKNRPRIDVEKIDNFINKDGFVKKSSIEDIYIPEIL